MGVKKKLKPETGDRKGSGGLLVASGVGWAGDLSDFLCLRSDFCCCFGSVP